MYVPLYGTVSVKLPVDDVVAVEIGATGTPQGITVAVAPDAHVASSGRDPTATVKPASGAPEENSATEPVIVVGVGVRSTVGEGVLPNGPLLPPPLHETRPTPMTIATS
jgi:hypothetical protein